MPDNMDVTPGSGRTIAGDEIGGILFQRVKIAVGADGVATDLAPGQAPMAQSLPVAIASNQPPIQAVGSTAHIDVTLSLDTNAYAIGDVLAETQAIANAVRANDLTAVLQNLVVIDEDDQGFGIDLLFFSANSSLGAENGAPSISDAAARTCLGIVSIASGDFVDLGGSRVATKAGVGLVLKPATGTRTVYVAAIARGAGTYTASGISLRLGILQD